MADLINGLGGSAGFGENNLGANDDGSVTNIDLVPIFGAQGLDFFGTNYTSLSINNNGNITFGSSGLGAYTPFGLQSSNYAMIAPFFADVDTRGGATTVTAGGTSTGSNLVWYDLDSTNETLTITWDDVGYYQSSINKLNAFQLRLIGIGNGKFNIEFRYEDINWVTGSSTSSGGTDGLGGIVARAGYSAGDGLSWYEFDQAGDQTSMLDLESTIGNTGVAGLYRYSLRSTTVTNVYGTWNADILYGNDLNNKVYGYKGNDTLYGDGGADLLYGGLGDDSYYIDSLDTITELWGKGQDTVYVDFNYSLGTNLESLFLLGSSNINATGNWLSNTFRGNAGDNVFDGKGGNDTVTFENVTHSINADLSLSAAQVIDGNDTLLNIESLVGTIFNDILKGNSANNTLDGSSGDDKLTGGIGNDTLIGGDGMDTVVFLGATEDYVFDFINNDWVIIDNNLTNGNEGQDILRGIEKIQFSDATINFNANLGIEKSKAPQNPYIHGLSNGYKWADNNITYWFDKHSDSETWSQAMKDFFIDDIFPLFSAITPLTFTKAGSATEATLHFNLATPSWMESLFNMPGILGYMRFPTPNYFSDDWEYAPGTMVLTQLSNIVPDRGSDQFHTIIHELGHGLGLTHPHDHGMESAIFSGVTNTGTEAKPNYSTGDFGLNSDVFTMMSYNTAGSGVFDWSFKGYGTASSPMALDIAALQYLYGENTSFNNGHTPYYLPLKNAVGTSISTIWDTGGIDVIQHNGSTEAVIDLRAATIDAGSLTTNSGAGGYISRVIDRGVWDTDPKGIAGGFIIANGVVIENAVGGSNSDTLYGNEFNNLLQGRGGSDTLYGHGGIDDLKGGWGVDALLGGAGNDTLNGAKDGSIDILKGGKDNDTYIVNETEKIIEWKNSGIDTVVSSISQVLSQYVENLTLTAGADINAVGNAENNTLWGNDHKNKLVGRGGVDKLVGGLGADVFVFESVNDSGTGLGNRDIIQDFQWGDKIDLSKIDAKHSSLFWDNSFDFIGKKAFSSEGQLRYFSTNTGLVIAGNTDSDLQAEFQIELIGFDNIYASNLIV